MSNTASKYLCVIINRWTRKEYASYEIEAKADLYARGQAMNRYSKELKEQGIAQDHADWCVDCVEID